MTKKKVPVKKKTPVKKAPKKPAKSPGKKKLATKKQKTYVAIVLDKSGSMETIAPETISSFNEQIQTIKRESVGMDTKIILVTFNDHVNKLFFNVSVDNLQPLTTENYIPDGMTAMYDGICKTINDMESELSDINDPETAVLFTIITDGAENSSKAFNSVDVSDRIKRLKETKRWTFNLVGANIDLGKAAVDLNINKGNILKISSSKGGIVRGMTASTQMYGTYMTSRRNVKNSYELGVLSASAVYSADENSILDLSDEALKSGQPIIKK